MKNVVKFKNIEIFKFVKIVRKSKFHFDLFQKNLLNSIFLSIFNLSFQSENISLYLEINTNIKTIQIYTIVVQFAHQLLIT